MHDPIYLSMKMEITTCLFAASWSCIFNHFSYNKQWRSHYIYFFILLKLYSKTTSHLLIKSFKIIKFWKLFLKHIFFLKKRYNREMVFLTSFLSSYFHHVYPLLQFHFWLCILYHFLQATRAILFNYIL